MDIIDIFKIEVPLDQTCTSQKKQEQYYYIIILFDMHMPIHTYHHSQLKLSRMSQSQSRKWKLMDGCMEKLLMFMKFYITINYHSVSRFPIVTLVMLRVCIACS